MRSKMMLCLLLGMYGYRIAYGQQKTQALPLDPAVKYGRLANGFTYYIRHNESPKDRVLLYLVNKAGSILEDEDQRGLAHFMEHMSFNGTKHFPGNQLEDYLQKAGVRFGADLNAYTGFDETVYQLPLPSDKPELLDKGLQIMRDWAHEATLDPKEIEKERGVVLEEERLRKGADQRLQRIYMPMLFNHSRYAERMPIGLISVLKNFKRPVIARFYNDWYRPDMQALVVVGDVDVNLMEKQVKAKFGDLKNPVQEKKRIKYTIPLTGKNQFMALTDKEQTATTVQVYWKFPAKQLRTEADYRNYLIRQLFNTMLNERYRLIATSHEPPFLGCTGEIGDFLSNLSTFGLEMRPKPGKMEQGLTAAWEELKRLKQYGFTQPELDRAKQVLISGMETQLKEKDKTNSQQYVNEYQSNFLKNEAAPGIAKEYALTQANLKTIGLTELNNLPKQYIATTNRDILILADEKEKATLPTEQTVNNWIKGVEEKPVTPYEEKTQIENLLTKEPVAGEIVEEKSNQDLGITTLKLSNGVTVILKPTTQKNDEILFTSFARGGISKYEDEDYQSAADASGLIAAGGAGSMDINSLRRYLAGKELGVQPYIGELYQGVNGKSTVKDLETCLRLLDGYLTEPRKDKTMFDNIINRSSVNLSNRGNNPQAVFQDSMLSALYNNNLRKTGPSLEKLKKIDLDRAYTIYKERLGDAAGSTYIFVGSFTTEQIKPLIRKYIASLPVSSSTTVPAFEDRKISMVKGQVDKVVYKGTEARATVSLIYSGEQPYDLQAVTELEALKEVLQIRVLERLREQESGVYSPQVGYSANKYPSANYLLQISFGCAPENVERLVASAKDEVAKLRANGPEQVNIDKWKAEYANQMDTNLKENSFWLNWLSGRLQNDISLDPPANYKQRLEKVTQSTLKAAANKYLSGQNFIKVVLLPEKK